MTGVGKWEKAMFHFIAVLNFEGGWTCGYLLGAGSLLVPFWLDGDLRVAAIASVTAGMGMAIWGRTKVKAAEQDVLAAEAEEES